MATQKCQHCSNSIPGDDESSLPDTCPNCGGTLGPIGVSDCPKQSDLEGYLGDRIPEAIAKAIEAHIESCDRCEGIIAELADDEGDEQNDSRSPTEQCELDEVPERIGRYIVEKLLGSGGFGRVFLCHDEQLERRVALKVPRMGRGARLEGPGGILAEARTLASLDHPNIVSVFDFDFGSTAGAPPFIVSQFVDGVTLSDYAIGLAWPEALAVVISLADALHSAHQKRIVHRDIKPANILIDDQGTPLIVDFGIALRDIDYGDPVWQAGSLGYLSPEQAKGEGHLVDGRSDIFSLGVVLYELIVGARPFVGDSAQHVLERVVSLDPRPPRQTNREIPSELERICLKCLEKRPADRYSNAADLADDLRSVLDGQTRGSVTSGLTESSVEEPVVPRGLRSFDHHDSPFFLQLLPGPRDRNEIPESIAFWKARCDQVEDAFRVGLLYGPSGCGKSSFVKAGLMPRLSRDVHVIYVDCSKSNVESKLRLLLQRRFPFLRPSDGVVSVLRALRTHFGSEAAGKVLLILDQFEQWFGSRNEASQLVSGLRQCDGNNVQSLLLLRDDYWMAVSRLMNEIDVSLSSDNCRAIDLFDTQHAKRVLHRLGTAFGQLPTDEPIDHEANEFLDRSVAELADQNELVIPVQLSVYADMLKAKPWTSKTLNLSGGSQGVGVRFLDEAFVSTTAPPQYRVHKNAARSVLRALLPSLGSDIRDLGRSRSQLKQESGYGGDQEFDDLMTILDSELRIVSCVEAEDFEPVDNNLVVEKYQLTHDYLVPSIREWLHRDDLRTFEGRANRLLLERSEAWRDSGDNRNLPTFLETVKIKFGTRAERWNVAQEKMMALATKRHTVRLSGVVAIAAIVAALVGIVSASKETQRVELLVSRLADARPENVADTIKQLDEAGPTAVQALVAHATQEGDPDWPGLALTRLTGTAPEPTLSWLLGADLHELFAVQQTLSHGLPESFVSQLMKVLQDRDADPLALRNALCTLSFASDETITIEPNVADKIASLVVTKKPQRQLASYLDNSSNALIKPLMRLFGSGIHPNAENAAEWLLALASDDEAVLIRLATERGDEHFARIMDLLPSSPVVERMLWETLDRNAEQFMSREGTFEEKEIAGCRAVRAAVGLIRAGQGESVWPLLLSDDDPRIRARLISKSAFLLDDPRPIVDRLLTTESDSRLRAALLLMLSRFDSESASPRLRESVLEATRGWFVDDSDACVHSAARCLLSSWGESRTPDRLATAIVPKDRCGTGGWLVDPTCGTTMVRIDVDDFMMGSEPPPYPSERLHRRRVNRSILLGATEITFEQFQEFVHASGEHVVGPLASAPRASDSPQMYVTWHHAASYCNWLSSQAGFEKEQWCYDVTAGGKARGVETALQRTGYRLPTEAEWEFACRAGTSTKYFHGETPEFLADYGWYGKTPADAQPVAKLMPNEFGLFDMYGNALEWCHGFPASYSDPRANRGSLTQRRAQRGGHIAQPKPELVRSAIRYSDLPGTSNPTYGFRIARTINP